MALHEQCVGKTDEWYTPPHVFEALGCRFDTDVASPGADVTPWIPTKHFITKHDERVWCGFIWMNPPFGGRNGIKPWLENFYLHGNGIALTPDRTSAPWWKHYSAMADAVLFVSPKIHFIDANGIPQRSPPQGTTLFAAGDRAATALYRAARNGLGNVMVPSDLEAASHGDVHGCSACRKDGSRPSAASSQFSSNQSKCQ
jgi:hypothetical protein